MAVAGHTCLNTGLKVVTESGIVLGELVVKAFNQFSVITDCELVTGGRVFTEDGLASFLVERQSPGGYNLSVASIDSWRLDDVCEYREMVREVISSWCEELGMPEKISRI